MFWTGYECHSNRYSKDTAQNVYSATRFWSQQCVVILFYHCGTQWPFIIGVIKIKYLPHLWKKTLRHGSCYLILIQCMKLQMTVRAEELLNIYSALQRTYSFFGPQAYHEISLIIPPQHWPMNGNAYQFQCTFTIPNYYIHKPWKSSSVNQIKIINAWTK